MIGNDIFDLQNNASGSCVLFVSRYDSTLVHIMFSGPDLLLCSENESHIILGVLYHVSSGGNTISYFFPSMTLSKDME